MNASILGGLIAAVLVFVSSLLVPVISKRLNKATDAAANAERSASSAEKLSGSALALVERVEKECNRCNDRLSVTRGALESLIEVTERVLSNPLDDEAIADLVATLASARRSLWSDT